MVPNRPGTYALILNLVTPATIEVGRLGRLEFPEGWYVYAGSAHGPGGLAARVDRHLRSSKSQHWHIDYLCPQSHTAEIWYALGTERWECTWAQTLIGSRGATIPAPRFGASDCQCPAHLVRFVTRPQTVLLTSIENGSRIYRVLR